MPRKAFEYALSGNIACVANNKTHATYYRFAEALPKSETPQCVNMSYTGLKRYAMGGGRYQTKRPTVQSEKIGQDIAVTVSHREFITDITVEDSKFLLYPASGYSLNPGQSNTFPWLSNIAQNFTSYKCHGGNFTFVSTYGNAVGASSSTSPANAALGSVSMAIQYDTVLPPWTTKQAMLADTGSISARPSNNMVCKWNVTKENMPISKLYVRPGEPAANSDLRMYDFGTLYVAVEGMQIPIVEVEGIPVPLPIKIGELWVDYSFTFYKPLITPVADEPPDNAPVVATSYIIIKTGQLGWGGVLGSIAGSVGAFGDLQTPANTQQIGPDTAVLYPVLPGGAPDNAQIAALKLPSFTGDTIYVYPEQGASRENQRYYRTVISYKANTPFVNDIGLVATNYVNPATVPSTPPTVTTSNAWLLNNVTIANVECNDVTANAVAASISSWSFTVTYYLTNPSEPGTIAAKYDNYSGNERFPPATATATGGADATVEIACQVTTTLIPFNLANALYVLTP